MLGFSTISLKIYEVILILYLPVLVKKLLLNKKLYRLIKHFVIEWKYLLLLTFVFGVLIPWEYKDELRSLSQRAFLRSLIQIVRLFLAIFSMLIPIFWIKFKIISLKKLFKIISYVVILTFTITIIDFLSAHQIRGLIPGARLLEGRFSGLNGEPRLFGKVMVFANILLYFAYRQSKDKVLKVAFYLTFAGIFLSASASAAVSLLFIVVPLRLIFLGFRKAFLIPVVFFIGLIIYTNGVLEGNGTVHKMELALGITMREKNTELSTVNEPALFTNFEVFDRAALNFLWNNPLYIFIGTGPNLISIPSSEYVDSYSRGIYGDVINSVPHSYFINVLSRSGLIGIYIIFLFFIRFNRKLKRLDLNKLRLILITAFIVNLTISSSLFFFVLGIIISIYIKYIYDNNSDTSSKFS